MAVLLAKTTTLLELLHERAKSSPHTIAFTFHRSEDTSSTLSFQALLNEAEKLAQQIQEKTDVGDPVLMLSPFSDTLLIGLFACLMTKRIAAFAPFPPTSRNEQALQNVIHDLNAALVITPKEVRKVKQSKKTAPPPFPIALIQYSSGSTKEPKGILLTEENLISSQQMLYEITSPLKEKAIIVGFTPPSHSTNILGSLLHTLYLNGEATLFPPDMILKNPKIWLSAITAQNANLSFAPNFAFELALQKVEEKERGDLNLRSWKMALTGGEPIKASTLRHFIDAYSPYGFSEEALLPCYGLAEAGLIVTGTEKRRPLKTLLLEKRSFENGNVILASPDSKTTTIEFVSSGKPLVQNEVLILELGKNAALPDDQVGEVVVQGKNVSPEYPTLKTGDLGFFHEGELYITGRIKEQMHIQGQIFYPTDVESTLLALNLPFVDQQIIAFPLLDRFHEGLGLIVEIKREALQHFPLEDAAASLSLATQKEHNIAPLAIAFVAPHTLPLTSTGKIRRSVAILQFQEEKLKTIHVWKQQHFKENLSKNPSPPLSTEATLESFILALLSKELEVHPDHIHPQKPFVLYGVDQLIAVRITSALSKRLKKNLSESLFWDHPTLEQLVLYLQKIVTQG